jgi:hypothetical protein
MVQRASAMNQLVSLRRTQRKKNNPRSASRCEMRVVARGCGCLLVNEGDCR